MELAEKRGFRGLDKVFHRSPPEHLFSVIPALGFGSAIVCHSDRSRTIRECELSCGVDEIVTKQSASPPLKGERNSATRLTHRLGLPLRARLHRRPSLFHRIPTMLSALMRCP